MPTDPKRIQDLFLRLVQLPPAERAAALDRDCGADLSVRKRVSALLQAHDEPDSYLDSSGENIAATLDSASIGADPAATGVHAASSFGSRVPSGPQTLTADGRREELAGAVIGRRYTLEEKIGEGGMGEVWVAKQTEPVKRKVALKLIKTGMDSRAVLQRFEQERQALALMDHPHIARVLDGGVTSTGQPFFVMELVNGLSLTKFCDELKLTLRERLELFVPICQAVQHAHQKGIVHRDLKPANILVTMLDGKPVPKVIDFGVAKAISGKLTEETMSTGFGAVVGTLEYMSPEQAGFSGDDVDTRADIYSLGVILYELLTGLRPLDAVRLRKAAITEMIRIIQEEEPSKPSTRLSTDQSLPSLAALRRTEPKKLMALLRGELDWVVMKCLEKQRDRRYDTANALARDVQRFLANEVVEARPPSASYRLNKFVKRHKGQVIAASVVLFALLAGIAGTTWGLIEARKQRAEAQRQEQLARNEAAKKQEALQAEAETAERERRAKEEAQAAREQEATERGYAEAIAEFVKDDFLTLTSVEGQEELGGDELTRDATLRDLLNRAASKLNARQGLAPRTEAELNWIIGVSYRRSGDSELAIPFLERCVELRRQVFGREAPLTLEAQNSLAVAYQNSGYYDQAQTLYEETVAGSKSELGPDHKDTLARMRNLASFYIHAWKEELALALIEDALTRQKATLGFDHKDTLASMATLAAAHGSKGNFALEVAIMEDALRIAAAKIGPDTRDLDSLKLGMARAYMRAGKFDKALPIYEESLKLKQAKLEPGHPSTRSAMNNLAGAYEEMGKLDLALPLYEQALKNARDKYGPDHPATLIGMSNLGRAYVEADRVDQALPLLEESYQRHKARFGANHPDTLTSMNNLGFAYLSEKTDESGASSDSGAKVVPWFEEVIKIAKVRLGPSHPDTFQCMTNLVMAYRHSGKKELASATAEETVERMKSLIGADHPRTLKAANNLALTYADAGRHGDALRLLRDTVELYRARLGSDHPDTVFCMLNLAMAYQHDGDFAAALPLLEESYPLLKSAFGLSHFRTIACLRALGESLMRTGQVARRIELLEEEVRLRIAKFGPEQLETMIATTHLGVMYWREKKFEKSVPLFEDLLKLQTEKFGRDNVETLATAANLAVNYRDSGRMADALPLFEEAYRGSKNLPESVRNSRFRFIGNYLLDGYSKTDNRVAAAHLLLERLPEARQRLPKESVELAGMLAQIGMGLLEEKKWTEAEAFLRECLAIREVTQPENWSTFNTKSLLGGALVGQNKYAEAEPLLVAGYEGMKQREAMIPAQGKIRLPEAIDRLVKLYAATEKPDELMKWQAERAKYPAVAETAKENE